MAGRIHEKLIQRQINHWSRLREVIRTAPDPERVRPLPVVTISRELGCGCRELAETLGERLGLQVYGREIVETIARDRQLSQELLEQLDERVVSQIELWVRGMLDRRMFVQDDYHVALVRTVRTLAAHGGVVFLGRGANFILAERADLRLRLVANEATRIARLAMREEIAPEEARRRIRESDEQRAAYVRKLFRADLDDPLHYDLVINTDHLDCEGMPDLVLFALAKRQRHDARAAASRA